MAFAAVVLAGNEILIATLMFHSAACPFASIIDVHIAFGVILKDFRVCAGKRGIGEEGARLALLDKTRRHGWLHS